MTKGIRITLAVALAVLAAAATTWFAVPRPAAPGAGGLAEPGQVAAPFVLTDSAGAPFDSERLKGRVALVFFGFTHCPDVCPTTLALMTNVLETLGPDARSVQPVFISVDPERDTPAALQRFGALFDSRIAMLTGAPDDIAKVAAAYHVYARRVPLKDGGYTMDHTASVFIFDRAGRFRSTFNFGDKDETILDKIRLVLGAGPT